MMGSTPPTRAELELLIEFASGKKSFEQVRSDAEKFHGGAVDLKHLLQDANVSRGITKRLKDLTDVDKESLSWFQIRCKEEEPGVTTRKHPISLLSTRIEALMRMNPDYFDVVLEEVSDPAVVASSFTNSPEYQNHELVRSEAVQRHVVPVGVYSDGVKVCDDTHPDSFNVIYVYFLHKHADDVAKPESKHLYTVYRKSDSTKETLADIWHILLWELKALASGYFPLKGEETKALAAQRFGRPISDRHCFALMQIKGDWSWYVEALGLWQWNSRVWMCPFCGASRDGETTWHNFSLQAPWLRTCRDQARYLQDMELSKTHGFRRSHSPFAFEPVLVQAPFFKWSMVKLDWQHAMDLGTLGYELGEAVWSLLPALALSSSHGAKRDRATGLAEFKRRLRKYYSEKRVDSRIPIRRFGLTKVKGRGHPKMKAAKAGHPKVTEYANGWKMVEHVRAGGRTQDNRTTSMWTPVTRGTARSRVPKRPAFRNDRRSCIEM